MRFFIQKSALCLIVSACVITTPLRAADNEIPASTGTGPFTAPIQGEDGTIHVVRYLNFGGRAIAFGDVDIGEHAAIQKDAIRITRDILSRIDTSAAGVSKEDLFGPSGQAPVAGAINTDRPAGAQIFGLGLKKPWPNGRVPYEIDASITDADLKKRIGEAAAIWNTLGVVTIKPKEQFKPADIAGTKTLVIQLQDPKNPDEFYCASNTGYLNTVQNRMWLSNACGTYNLVHEFGHTLGLKHEHGRADRGTLLAVDMSKIKLTEQVQYDVTPGDYFGTSHDLCSIEHYRSVAPGKSTVSGKPETWFTLTEAGKKALASCQAKLKFPANCTDKTLPGQRCVISETDQAAIKSLYKTTLISSAAAQRYQR